MSGVLLAFLASLAVAFVATPLCKAIAWRTSFLSHPSDRGIHQRPTPLLGGVAIFLAFLAGATVVGVPGRAVEEQRRPVLDLEHGRLPDPVNEALKHVLDEQDRLAQRLKRLEESLAARGARHEDRASKEGPRKGKSGDGEGMAHG